MPVSPYAVENRSWMLDAGCCLPAIALAQARPPAKQARRAGMLEVYSLSWCLIAVIQVPRSSVVTPEYRTVNLEP
jgi:hypothetical protein